VTLGCICSRSQLPAARVLAASIDKHHPEL